MLVFKQSDYPRHRLSRRSRSKMKGLHGHMKAVTSRASELLRDMDGGVIDFRVGECVRSEQRQDILMAAGRSKTRNSRHLVKQIKEYGEWQDRCAAIDLIALVHGEVTWNWPAYHVIAKAMKQAAKELDVDIDWGGDWRTFKDGPHFQLSWRKYPVRNTGKTRFV